MVNKAQYTGATQNLGEAIRSVAGAIENGYTAWIEVIDNKDAVHPYKILNPELEDINNWTMLYGVPGGIDYTRKFKSEVEKDLYFNYIPCFATPEARKLYIEKGEVTPDLFKGSGEFVAVKRKDAIEYRKDKDGYKYDSWIHEWTNKKEIQRWIPDPNVKDVYVVFYSTDKDDKADKIKCYLHLSNFLHIHLK